MLFLIMCSWILVVSSVDILRVLGLPFLAVIGVTTFSSMWMSFGVSLHSSIGLNPVSMLSWIFSDSLLLASAISIKILSFFGGIISLSSGRYKGIVHSIL